MHHVPSNAVRPSAPLPPRHPETVSITKSELLVSKDPLKRSPTKLPRGWSNAFCERSGEPFARCDMSAPPARSFVVEGRHEERSNEVAHYPARTLTAPPETAVERSETEGGEILFRMGFATQEKTPLTGIFP